LPYSIKRGEVVAIPIVVFNYMESDEKAEVTLHNDENEFEFAEFDNQVNRRRKRATDSKRTKQILVKSNSGTSVSFMIKPTKVGSITIKVTATSAIAGDGIEKQLLVEPEGVTQYVNKAILIDLRENSEYMTNVTIDIPQNAIPDSTKIEAAAVGKIKLSFIFY
jgi:CD109 antigen